jgi:small subunit ribosomal protein S21
VAQAYPIGVVPAIERRWHPCDSGLLLQSLGDNSPGQGRCLVCNGSASTAQSHSQCALNGAGAMPMHVLVRDNNVDQALRVLKKKMQREGVFREMKRRRFYEKPSVKATREKAESARRARKLARKQAVRDGLIAAPKKKRVPIRKAAAMPRVA